MMDSNLNKLLVEALYKFKASNNDELTFKKGDLITVTQKEDGGWWEGTSHKTGKTGWFPSNYVKERVASDDTVATVVLGHHVPNAADEIMVKQQDYRQQVIKDLVAKEKEFVSDMDSLISCYLEPLRREEILTAGDYQQLVGNIDEVLEVHRCMLAALQDAQMTDGHAPREQRIGRILLNHGSNVRSAHFTYWSNHPRAVCVLEKHRNDLDGFMENYGSSKPGLMVLTTSLSRPLRHLEKYAASALELEQHLEDDHPDRGDTQRSVAFYKNVAADCAKLRRQKEMELEVLSGTIRDWEGEEGINNLGDIIHMGAVLFEPEHLDRYLVLFPSTLLLLSVSSRLSAFIYEGKLPLSGIAVNRLEDIDSLRYSFEITGPMIDRKIVVCSTRQEQLKWVELLRHHIKVSRSGAAAALQQLPQPPHQLPFHSSSPGHLHKGPSTRLATTSNHVGNGFTWKMSCLRPAPPTRFYLGQSVDVSAHRRSASVKKPAKDNDTSYDDDMQILRVIEAYCWSKNPRQTMAAPSTVLNLDNLSFLVDKEDLMSSIEENGNMVNAKTTHDRMQLLEDHVRQLQHKFACLQHKLEEEVAARKKLEDILICSKLLD